MIRSAMILAAGRGERMRPLTDKTPKPLIPIAGRSTLDRAIDRLHEHGVRNLVINVHHLGEQIARHVKPGHAHIVREEQLLETGGSVKNALPLLGEEPFFVLNGDGLWTDGAIPMLKRMEAEWDPARMSQTVSNLVGNALTHGERGAPVHVSVHGDEREVDLEVHNSGPPIPSDLLPVLFQPFRRGMLEDGTSWSLGLGLYIVDQIVAAHGGTVSVRSTAQEGTTFTVHLPRTRGH